MPKISVIMPVLNMVDYFEECLQSVLQQNCTDLEILIIDAGSTDGTLEIIEDWKKKDNRIQLLHSTKRSYGYQVNLGLDVAQGEYIGIIDTDDMLTENAYTILLDAMVRNQLDYVKGYAKLYWNFGNGRSFSADIINFFIKENIHNQVICPSEFPGLIVKDHFLWQGLYSKKLLKGIRLNETAGAAYQDQGFCLQVYAAAQRGMYIDYPVYLYRQNNETSSTYNKNGLEFVANEFELNRSKLRGLGDAWHTNFYLRLWDSCQGRFEQMAACGNYWSHATDSMERIKVMFKEAICRGYLGEKDFYGDKWRLLQYFMEEPQKVYHNLREKYEKVFDSVTMLLGQIQGTEVVIVGCGVRGRFLCALFLNNQISVKTYCDNNEALYGEKRDGIPIMSLQDAVSSNSSAKFVISSNTFNKELYKQLMDLQVDKSNILSYDVPIDYRLLLNNFFDDT